MSSVAARSLHIVAITGSLRTASANTGLLRAMKQKLPAGHTMEIVVPDLPLFNSDIEGPDLLPAAVTIFRNKVKAADCFIFASPEYNFSLSGALKNAIDWASRGPDGNLFNDKAAAVVSAGGGAGGLRSQEHLRDVALFLNLHVMNKPALQVGIFSNPSPFDKASGDLVDAALQERAGSVVTELLAWSHRLNPTFGKECAAAGAK